MEHKAKINLRKKNGASPLYVSCQEGNENIVQLLLSYEADINLCMKDGARLIGNGAIINARDEYEASPLNVACQRGYDSIVQLLLSKGADINLCDKFGVSPLDIARERGHYRIVQLLKAHRKIDISSLFKWLFFTD